MRTSDTLRGHTDLMTKKNSIPTVLIHVAKWAFARRLQRRPLTIAPQFQLTACRTPSEFLLECQKSPAGVIVDLETLPTLLPDLQKLPIRVAMIVAVFGPTGCAQEFELMCRRHKNVNIVDWFRAGVFDRVPFSEALRSFAPGPQDATLAKQEVRALPRALRSALRKTFRGKVAYNVATMRELKQRLRMRTDCSLFRLARLDAKRIRRVY